MTQQYQQPTAKIYQFPKRPRAASGNQHTANQSLPRDERFAAVEFGTGWYHQAAVDDDAEDAGLGFRKH